MLNRDKITLNLFGEPDIKCPFWPDVAKNIIILLDKIPPFDFKTMEDFQKRLIVEYWHHYDGLDKGLAGYKDIGICLPVTYEATRTRKWQPSLFMPKSVSQILLEITEIRVERVRETTEEDAIAEGIDQNEPWGFPDGYINSFAWLWDSLNAKRGYGWEVNPWVWVITFKKLG